MKKSVKLLLSSMLALVVLGGALIACGETSTPTSTSSSQNANNPPAAPQAPTQPPTQAPTPTTPKSWVTVQQWTGSSNHKTETFTLKDGDRVVWSAKPTESVGGNFVVWSYATGGDMPNDLLVNEIVKAAASGTSNIHGDVEGYLDIEALFVTYTIKVERYQ